MRGWRVRGWRAVEGSEGERGREEDVLVRVGREARHAGGRSRGRVEEGGQGGIKAGPVAASVARASGAVVERFFCARLIGGARGMRAWTEGSHHQKRPCWPVASYARRISTTSSCSYRVVSSARPFVVMMCSS